MARDPIYAFSHQKISEVVYAEAGTARRRMLHRRTFEVLQGGNVPAADLAHHALNAGLLAEAIRYSLIAGNEAMNLFAARVALTHFETAWQIVEQSGWPNTISGADKQALYSSLGRAYELSEAWAKAEEVYQAMIAAAQAIESSAMACQGLNQLATIYYLKFNKEEEAIALLERALAIAEKDGNKRGMAETELNLAMAAYQNHNHHLTLHHAERALAVARNLAHPSLMARQLSILAYVALQRREWEKVESYAAEASRLYTESGMLILAADSDRNLGFGQLLSGKPQEALVTFAETAVFSQHIENLWGEGECAWKLAFTHLELGHYGQAIQLAKAGVEMTRKLGIPSAIDLSLIIESMVQRKTMCL
jgi:tetratricopeptide (TPR) repeat protein